MVIIASVAINGAIRLAETRYPEIPPTATPAITVRISASGSDIEKRKYALRTLARATTEPTERSIPPVRITSSIPILIIPIPETCLRRLKMFRSVKKASEADDEKIKRTTKIKAVLYFKITFVTRLARRLTK
jgi:hypothetical protein